MTAHKALADLVRVHALFKAQGSVDPVLSEQAWAAAREALAQPEPEPRRTTGWAAPRDRYVPPVLFNPYTGEPRDMRDVQSDPQGILLAPPGAAMLAAAPPPPPPALPELSEKQRLAAVMRVRNRQRQLWWSWDVEFARELERELARELMGALKGTP
jgi:hypothetical protein